MKNILNYTFTVAIIASSSISCASQDVMSYYLVGTKKTNCDAYVRNNVSFYEEKLNDIYKYYVGNDRISIKKIVEGSELTRYIDELSDCSLSYRYFGDYNYFRTAHAHSVLLLDVVNNPNRKYIESPERVAELIEDIVDDLNKVTKSVRVDQSN